MQRIFILGVYEKNIPVPRPPPPAAIPTIGRLQLFASGLQPDEALFGGGSTIGASSFPQKINAHQGDATTARNGGYSFGVSNSNSSSSGNARAAKHARRATMAPSSSTWSSRGHVGSGNDGSVSGKGGVGGAPLTPPAVAASSSSSSSSADWLAELKSAFGVKKAAGDRGGGGDTGGGGGSLEQVMSYVKVGCAVCCFLLLWGRGGGGYS